VNAGRLLLPAVRWHAEHGYQLEWEALERGLQQGVGGFILFGGEAAAVRDLTEELQRRSAHPLLIASDLERGAGQQFRGATPLPPAAAIGSLDDLEATRRAGEITARDARALGVNWVYAPVADVDLEPENPIIGTRAFGTDPERVALQVAAWTKGCAQGGALSCAKHFPGHGRTIGDSHIERPRVMAGRELLEMDLIPFRAVVDAGVDGLMTAHVSYPALDPSGSPATLSAPILHDLLRREMGFEGLVVTDALIMEGLIDGIDEASAAVIALQAGCDALLYPEDMAGVCAGVEAALRDGRLAAARVQQALTRIDRAARRMASQPGGRWGLEEDRRWALETAVRSLQIVRGEPSLPGGPIRLIEVEDDLGGPFPPYPRTALPAALRAAGADLSDGGSPLVALYSDIRAWKGRPGLSPAAQRRVREITSAHPDATVVLFSHPRLEHEIPGARNLLAAWGGEALMQEAVAAKLTGRRGELPTAASGLDR
jgi:beta-glucosidase-like glycosyl hydrolase